MVYYLIYRETRLILFLKEPRKEWRVFVFDLFIYVVCGGLVTVFVIDPSTLKEAFIGGCAWEGLVGGTIAGKELKMIEVAKQEIELKIRPATKQEN